MTDDADRSPWVGEQPPWDEENAEALRGAYVIVGITTVEANGDPISQVQFHGRVTIADPERGICIALEGAHADETYWMPPQPESFQSAPPGEYRLRSTGEVITDPDFTTTWTITKPAKS
jgi:hypothetical protein